MVTRLNFMDPFIRLTEQIETPLAWELAGLNPTPEEEWPKGAKNKSGSGCVTS